MMHVTSVLIAVASELAVTAKSHLPDLEDGEEIQHEYLKNGTYVRVTNLNGQTYKIKYDFRQRKSYRVVISGKSN